MTYLDNLNTKAIELSKVVPRISIWDNDTVRLYQKLDMISEEDGTYGGLSVSLLTKGSLLCTFLGLFSKQPVGESTS